MKRKAAAATTTIAINGGLKSMGDLDGGDWWMYRDVEYDVGASVGPKPDWGRWWSSGGFAAIF